MQVDRRTLFGAAGATVALAACKSEVSPTNETVMQNDPSKDQFGKDPSNKVPAASDPKTGRLRPAGYEGGFKPKHDYLAYMKFEGGRLIVRTAYFKSVDGAENPKAVAERFQSVIKTQRWSEGAEGTRDSFADFGFGSQARLYFYLDNGSDVRFDDINLIHMTLYKVKDKKTRLPKDNAFINIEIRDIGGLPMLYVENWYAQADGKPIEEAKGADIDDPVEFSMNIHLLMKSGTDDKPFDAPIVLDPEGTNGRHLP